MLPVFIINPCAGGENHVNAVTTAIQALGINAEIYVTQGTKDATRFVNEYCHQHTGESPRFIACGGDGTLNEVVSGVVGHPDAEVGCYPCGSGNDYVKYWPEANFRDIKALIESPAVDVDVMKVTYQADSTTNVRYAINTMNYGFEAEVCRVMENMRRFPILGGKMSYTTGIVKCLFTGRHNPCSIAVEGTTWRHGDMLLATLANGRYAGGGFLCAPRSLNDDGLIEVTTIRPISIVRFASIIKYYKNGEYLDHPKLKDIVSYCRGRRVTIESDRLFYIGIDGELLHDKRFEIENLPHALRFIVPKQ